MQNKIAKVYVSNDAAVLRKKLVDNLQAETFPLRKIIVTPSPILELEFIQSIKADQCLCGCKIMQLHSAIDYLIRLLKLDTKFKFKFPSPNILAFHIECILRDIHQSYDCLDPCDKELLLPLRNYLHVEYDLLFNKKVKELAYELSRAFQILSVYGSQELKFFLEKNSWQKVIWEKVYTNWSYLYLLDHIEHIPPVRTEASFHFFCFSHIPKVVERFFLKLSQSLRTFYYFLSPSPFYYGDVLPEKSRLKTLNSLSSEKKNAYDELTKSAHPLIANWGKLFSERQNFLEDHVLDVEELFISPLSQKSFSFAHLKGKEKEKSFLLNYIKDDLLLMDLSGQEPLSCDRDDFSFQIHEAKTKLREVQNLKNVLLNLIDKHKIAPKNISIYAPEISDYYPYLSMVFEKQDPMISLHVLGLDELSQSPYLLALTRLFSMRYSRFSKTDVMKLFSYKAVQKAARLSKLEIQDIEKACELAHIYFGFNKKHKEKILSRFSDKPTDITETGTFDHGLKKLIFGMSCFYDETINIEGCEKFFPIEGIDFSQSLTFGKFIKYLYDLFDDLTLLSSHWMNLDKWCDFIKLFANKYLSLDESEDKDTGYHLLLEELKTLSSLSDDLNAQKLSFEMIESYLKKAMSKKLSKMPRQVNSVYVNSLSLGALKPSSVICLLGMQEGFPRIDKKISSLHLDPKFLDDYPLSQESDRHLLLEALLQARLFFVTSYVGVSEEDGKPLSLSFALEELLALLDEYYHIDNEPISKSRFFRHKLLEFDKSYFVKSYPFNLYSQDLYTKASSFYGPKESRSLFIEEFYKVAVLSKKEKRHNTISLSHLRSLASNPINFYFKNVLGIRLNEKSVEKDDLERGLFSSALNRFILKKNLLYQDIHEVFDGADKRGEIPEGIYQNLLFNELNQYKQKIIEECLELNIQEDELYFFKLSTQEKKIFYDEGKKMAFFPALEIDFEGEKISFVGEIDSVTKKGLFFHGKDCFEDLLKIWPEYLIYVLLDKREDFQNGLLLGQSSKIRNLTQAEALKALKDYLHYYFYALNHPSPFFPTIAEAMASGKEEKITKEIIKIFRKSPEFLDPYTKWCITYMEPFCGSSVHNNWSTYFHKHFELFMKWEQGDLA